MSDGTAAHTFDVSGPSALVGGTSYGFTESADDTGIDASATQCTHSSTVGSHSFSCDGAQFDRLVINMGVGADTVRINYCAGIRCFAMGAVSFPITENGFAGNDVLAGGSGDDTLNGGDGDDQLNGGAGNDTLNGDNNNDTLNGGVGNDTLNAGTDAGNDTLIGGSGDDGLLDGGPGFDTVSYDDGRTNGVTVTMGDGIATQDDGGVDDNSTAGAREAVTNVESLIGSGNADTLTGSDSGVTIAGRGGDDTITGGAGNDTLEGEAGNDTLQGAGGQDDLSGGADTDTASYADHAAAITATVGDNSFNDGAAGENDRIGSDVERIVGGSGNDSLSGASAPAAVTLDGAAGDDTLTGSAFDDTLLGGAGADSFTGGAGVDTASYADHGSGVNVSLATGHGGNASDGAGDSIAGVENLVGTSYDDVLAGDSGVNNLQGMGGNDTVQGGAGDDTLSGGAGTDTVDYSERTSGQPVNVSLDGTANDGAAGETDNIGPDFEAISGGAGDDTLSASVAGATLIGNAGNDTLYGPNGGGTLLGGLGNDKLTGGDGADTIDGGLADDTIDGQGGSDTITGGPGNDSIEARDGVADSVDCGPDNDTALTDSIDTRVACELPATQQAATSTQPTTTTTPPPGSTAPRVAVTVSFKFVARAKFTIFKSFVVKKIPRGSKLTVTCKGKKCPLKKAFVKKKAHGSVKIKALLKKHLRPGTKITVVVSKRGAIGAVRVITIRKHKRPAVKTLCLAPGAKKPSRCTR